MSNRKCLDCGSTNVWCECESKVLIDPSELPTYLIRPGDLMVFSLNDDQITYSTQSGKKEFPNHFHQKYPYRMLASLGFYTVKGLSLETTND